MPLKNGLTRPKAVRGAGEKMINMGELFAHDRIADISMDLVPVSAKERSAFAVKNNDLLFARQSLVFSGAGKCSIYLGRDYATFESHIIRARLDQSIAAPLYYYYYFRSSFGRSAIESIVEQVAAAGIRGSDLAGLEVPYPDLSEQRAIASILGALDDKIELNRKMSAALEAMARALFKSWFVDFDPVRAKAEGRDPCLQPEIAALFPDSFEDSELGKIPKGWHAGSAEELFSIQNGYAFRSKDWLDAGVPVVKIGSVKPGIVDLESVSYVSKDIAEGATRFRLGVGDLLIGMTGYVGEVGLVPPAHNLPLLNQRVGKIVAKDNSERVSPFAYSFFRLPETKSLIEIKAQGSAQANVSAEGILSIPVAVSPHTVRYEYDRLCAPIIARILSTYGEISTLAALRNALLPKLISGEIRVANAERLVEQSA